MANCSDALISFTTDQATCTILSGKISKLKVLINIANASRIVFTEKRRKYVPKADRTIH